jgi:hypothetical protein
MRPFGQPGENVAPMIASPKDGPRVHIPGHPCVPLAVRARGRPEEKGHRAAADAEPQSEIEHRMLCNLDCLSFGDRSWPAVAHLARVECDSQKQKHQGQLGDREGGTGRPEQA